MITLKLLLKQLKPIPKVFLIFGTITAAVFGYYYLIDAGSHCGVVRFYEYYIGVFGLGVWLCGNATGLAMLIKSKHKIMVGIGTS